MTRVTTHRPVAAAANTTAAKPAKTPTAKQLNNVYGTYSFHKSLHFSGVPQPGVKLGKEIPLTHNTYPDAMNTSAYLVKGSPNLVVFKTHGGIAGIERFSQPVRWDVLPKDGPTPAPSPAPKSPTTKQLNDALAKNQSKLKWSGVPQPGATFGKSIALTHATYPDAMNTIAHVLKNAPDMVVFERVGGIAGIHTFSQPVRWN